MPLSLQLVIALAVGFSLGVLYRDYIWLRLARKLHPFVAMIVPIVVALTLAVAIR